MKIIEGGVTAVPGFEAAGVEFTAGCPAGQPVCLPAMW